MKEYDDQLAAVSGAGEYIGPAWYRPPVWSSGHIGHVEAAFVTAMVRAIEPAQVVEIGTAAGGSSSVFLHALHDLPRRPDQPRALHSWDTVTMCYFDRTRAVGAMVAELVPDLPRWPDVSWVLRQGTAVEAAQTGTRYPLAMIDANHIPPHPAHDLLMLLPVLAPGAWVILHDIHMDILWPQWVGGRVNQGGAVILWRELRAAGLPTMDAGPRSNIGAVQIRDPAAAAPVVRRILQFIT